MSVKTLKIDGIDVAILQERGSANESGSTILQAAQAAGIDIPTLCYLKGVSVVGACRLCMVEIAGVSKLFPACVTQVEEGMEVIAHSPKLKDYRRMVVELLFAEGNHICAFCVANDNCELQDAAVKVGMDHSRFPYRSPDRHIDMSHPLFAIDHNHCILCTRCVRVCDEIEGAHVWDVAYRGADCQIISGLNQPWGEVSACTDCGKCVDACPTGAIFRKSETSGERVRDPEQLEFLTTAREKHEWTR